MASLTPHPPPQLPPGLDALSAGFAAFEKAALPAPPEVAGFHDLTWLAAGGFGKVWRARRSADDLVVALKIPHRSDPESAERLEMEAGTLKALTHPNIVRLLDMTTTADAAPVLVMEYVDGAPLTARIPRDGFSFAETLRLLLPVLDAVACAHSRGIVHRDLKPGNILLTSDGTPKVTDFGLASSLRDQHVNFSLTMTGHIAGTVEYLAPERYEPDTNAGTAADIYALGIILHELLTGTPPRGAWLPPSQIKTLDVRLDELILHAIHRDPAKRLPSAEAFTKRLTEIRDTRPRYSGTPLVTRPVRYADFVWTVAGLYFLAGGFCSLLSMNNTKVPGIFDLTLHHTKLLGGYWSLWILCVGMGLVWSWQTVRLWHFRNIPLREALPSPFGLRLGHSRGAAALVALTQLLCASGPLAYIVWIYSQCWNWVTPETPVWEKALSITRWDSEEPVSAWTWDPAGMFSADEFWIREVQPGFTPGTWQLHDRQSFFVVTQPVLMTLGLAAIVAGNVTTCVAAFAEWRSRRRVLLGLFFGALIAVSLSFRSTIGNEIASRDARRADARQGRTRDNAARALIFSPVLEEFIGRANSASAALPDFSQFIAPEIRLGPMGLMSRPEFCSRLAHWHHGAAVSHQTIEALRMKKLRRKKSHYEHDFAFGLYTDPPGAPATGSFVLLTCAVTNPETGRPQIVGWSPEVTPLYSAQPEPLDPVTANTWIDAFLRTLTTDGCPDLESFLLPVMLLIEPTEDRQYSPAKRENLTTALRTSRAGWTTFSLTSAASPSVRSLPGARQEITCDLRQSGTHRDATSSSSTLHWQFELVYVNGRWQALCLRM